jgi:UDP-N-acetyl-D-mannosaminuronate dehydrogenase
VATLNYPDDLADCDGIILVTPHSLYRSTPAERLVQPGTVIVDNFGAWKEKPFQSGVRYHEVGRRFVEDARSAMHYPEPSSATS